MKKTLIILLLLSGVTQAQVKGGQLMFTIDNDFLWFFNNEDENYTGGFKLEYLQHEMKGLSWMPLYKYDEESSLTLQKLAIGGTAYTPLDLVVEPFRYDRPYASLMFLSIGNISYNDISNVEKVVQTDLIIGVMGAEGPGSVQDHIHENQWFGTERPVSLWWDSQIGEGGALVVNYNTRFEGKFFGKGRNTGFDLIRGNWVGKADFGNYMINLQGGFRFNLFNWNMDGLNVYGSEMPTIALKSYSSTLKWLRFNLFAEPHIRFVGYNATLEGLMFNDNSAYVIDHGDVKRLLFELNAGVNISFFDTVYLKYNFFGRSREFEGGKPFHTWGGITIGGSWMAF